MNKPSFICTFHSKYLQPFFPHLENKINIKLLILDLLLDTVSDSCHQTCILSFVCLFSWDGAWTDLVTVPLYLSELLSKVKPKSTHSGEQNNISGPIYSYHQSYPGEEVMAWTWYNILSPTSFCSKLYICRTWMFTT